VSEFSAALLSIASTIGRAEEVQRDLADTAERQSASTDALRQTISQAAAFQIVMNSGIMSAAVVADQAARGANGANDAASEVAVTADRMRELVGAFTL
jgi:methyl-accepting chemotaxis protein